jgi:hypothetical protein
VSANARVHAATGLPPAVTTSIENWDDFLMHGFLASYPRAFSIEQLTQAQYESVTKLGGNYFHAGYEFYSPRRRSFTAMSWACGSWGRPRQIANMVQPPLCAAVPMRNRLK